MREKITHYIRAGYAGLYVVSSEEQRVEAEVKAIAQSLKHHLFYWSVADGLVDAKSGKAASAHDPLEALVAIEGLKDETIVLLKDFHLFLQEPNPILMREALAQKTASLDLGDRERLLARIGAAGVDQRRELRGALADVDLPLGLVAFRRVIGEAVA